MINSKIKVTSPEDCGNAPKKLILRDFNIAFYEGNIDFILDNISDSITWNIIGNSVIEGKEGFIDKMNKVNEDKARELELYNLITHGYIASANGVVITDNGAYDFCHVYRFTGASKTAKIKEITSYIIAGD